MIFLILLLLVAAAIISPYINVVLKRRKMLKRICGIARQLGYRVRALHRFVCLSQNCSSKYDLLFENKDRAFAVKLWSSAKKNSVLVINQNGTFYETQSVPQPLEPLKKQSCELKSRVRGVPVTRENFKVKNGKYVEQILLYYPRNKEITVRFDDGNVGELEVGDKIFNKILCSPAKFEALLNEYAQIRKKQD